MEMLTVPKPGDDTALIRSSGELLVLAQGLVITNDEQLAKANNWLRDAASLKQKAVEHYKASKDLAFKLHRQLCDDEKKLQELPAKVDQVLRPKILLYQSQQRAAANKAADEARQAKIREEEEKRLSQAQQLADAGQPEVAEAVLDAPLQVAMPPPVAAPKLEGTATRTVLKFRIVDPAKVNRDYCVPDEKRIRLQVQALGMKAAAIVGGIEVYTEETLAVSKWKE